MFVVVILILFANCLCGPALSAVVETQKLSHGRSIRQAPNSSDTQTQPTEMNIAFDLPDITARFQLPSGSVQLEGFKSVNNDKVTKPSLSSQLFWVSIGHPQFIKTKDQTKPGNATFFHSTSTGFTTYVEMMTTEQRAALAAAARHKYQVEIDDRQVVHLILSKFYCNIVLDGEPGSRYLVSGNISEFRQFPLRMDFGIPPGKTERILFSKLITEPDSDLQFECRIESGGGKLIKTNTLSISQEQSEQIGLEEKLFGPAGSNGPNEMYVSRNQMSTLAHEMYSTLNIIEEYEMPETQFSEAFVNDFISQLASSQFSQTSIDIVLASISKYSFDISADLRPDNIKKDIGSFLSVNTSDGKSRIIVDEKKMNEWVNTNKVTTSASAGVSGLFDASFSAAVDISRSGATNDQSLNDQLRELNTRSQNEARWEIEGEKIVPKSLNVARIMRSNMKRSLTFTRVRIQQFNAPFARNFKMYTSRSVSLEDDEQAFQPFCQNISATRQMYREMLESVSHNVLYLMNASQDLLIQSQKIDSIQEDLMHQSQEIDSIQKQLPIRVSNGCPSKFNYSVNGLPKCYYVDNLPLSWNAASAKCNQLHSKARLAVIHSALEDQVISTILENHECATGGWNSWFWIGGRRTSDNCNSAIQWRPNNRTYQPLEYTNYCPSEPECNSGNLQYCLSAVKDCWSRRNTYGWQDDGCNNMRCAICEILKFD